jgi:predicted small secreted protein
MKKAIILTASALLLCFVVILAGCNNSSSSGGGFANVDVQYTVSGNTIIHNANTSRDITIPTQGTDFRILTWFCGNFEGDQNKQIELTFKKMNNTWVRDKKDVSGGNCS